MNSVNHGRRSLIKLYSNLINCKTDNIKSSWIELKECVNRDYNSGSPVAEYALLPKTIASNKFSTDKFKLKILNHGCGSGLADLYWVALGYTNLLAVDVYSEESNALYSKLNKILKVCDEIKDDIFFTYEGLQLPIGDKQVDIINSNAVVEHLSDIYYVNYFKEQGRVLKKGGIALHVIPQRLQPFDSHTQTWFVHWLPKFMQNWLIKKLGNYNPDLTLELRSKYSHLKLIRQHIGQCKDISIDYYMNSIIKDEDFYDNKSKRGFIFRLCNLPILKTFLPKLLSPLLCLIVVATRNA